MSRHLPLILATALLGGCNGWTHARVHVVRGTGTASFHVIDSNGAPVPSATLLVAELRGSTDADGSATVTLPEGGYLASLDATGFMADWRPLQIHAGRVTDVEWQLHHSDPSDVRLLFAGDISFNGGIADPNRDGIPNDALIPNTPAAADATLSLLSDVASLFGQFDFVTASLATVLGAGRTPHPLKPNRALAPAGVATGLHRSHIGALTLGNDHAWDYLDAGLADTIATLDAEGLGRFGAGRDLGEATTALVTSRNGLQFAQVAASALLGHGATPATDSPPYFDAGVTRGGVAPATRSAVRDMVQQALVDSTVVVAHLTSGGEWDASQDSTFADLSSEAATAGATLVVGHGPRPLLGVSLDGGVLVAGGLGQLVFGSNRPEGRYAALLEVTLRHRRVVAARLWPVVLVNYRPVLATGELGARIVRLAASRSSGVLVVPTNGRGEVLLGSALPPFQEQRNETRMIISDGAGPVTSLLQGNPEQVLSHVELSDGPPGTSLDLGRELLWEGTMEDEASAGFAQGAGWTLSGGLDESVSDRHPHSGRFSLELVRKADNVSPESVRTHGLRTLHAGVRYTFRGCWLLEGHASVSARLLVYPSHMFGAASTGAIGVVTAAPGAGDYSCFSVDVTPVVDTLVVPSFTLNRPATDTARLLVDDVSLVEWSPSEISSMDYPNGSDFEYLQLRSPASGNARAAWVTRRWSPGD